MAKARKKRTEYTPEQRAKVLAAAKAENLTAAQVQKKFGVTPVTYYSWRKKSGVTHKRGTRRGTKPVNAVVAVAARPAAVVARPAADDLGAQVRSEVQNKMRQIIPGIVRSEVSAYLDSIFGVKRVKRGRRRKKK
jgi:transposase-like protein